MNYFPRSPLFGWLLVVLLTRCTVARGQIEIVYDVCSGKQTITDNKTKVLTKPAIRVGRPVSLELVGVNPFYKQTIKFNTASIAWKTPEPENFGLITIPKASEETNPEPTDRGTEMVAPLHAGQQRQQAGARAAVENQRDALRANPRDIAILNQLLALDQQITAEIAASYTALVAAQSQATDAVMMLESIAGFQQRLTISPCLTKADYMTEETRLLANVGRSLGLAESITDAGTLAVTFKNKIEAYPLTYDLITIRQDQLQSAIDNVKVRIESITPKPPTIQIDASALVDEMQTTLDAFAGFLESRAGIISTLKSQLAGDEGLKISRVCATLFNNKTYFSIPFRQGPFMPDRNANEVIISATATRPAADDKGTATDFVLTSVKMPIIGNVQIDFTTGGLLTTLSNNAFVVRTNPSSTTAAPDTYTIQTNESVGGVVIATQANLIWQTCPSFGWGANIGVGVDVLGDQRARYVTGLSFKVGGLGDNFIISAGVVSGKVKRLSGELSTDITYQKTVTPTTYDKFEVGGYVGFSYILGSKKVKTQ